MEFLLLVPRILHEAVLEDYAFTSEFRLVISHGAAGGSTFDIEIGGGGISFFNQFRRDGW
jgi:hypothetical protein